MKNRKQSLGDKIFKGVLRAHKKLVAERIKNDDYMVVSINGKIVRKKARELYNSK
jgi:disulfide oxidoreductase YuzD